MLNAPSTFKIYLLNIVTFGFYLFYWCSRSRCDIHAAAKVQLIPTTWLMAVPGGAYWWMWKYAEALGHVSFNRIKSSETYLLYLIASHVPLILLSYFSFIPDTDTVSNKLFLTIFGTLFVVSYIFFTLGMAFFMATMQKRINRIKPASPIG